MNAKLVLLLVATVATFHFSYCEEKERILNRVRRAPKKQVAVQQIMLRCSWPAQLACSDQSNCILQSQRCDGQYNCRDGSDEANCAPAQQVYAVKQQQAPQVVMAPAPGAQPVKAEQQLQPQTVMMVAPQPAALTGFGQEIGMAIQGHNDASFANVNAEQCAQFCLESTTFFCRSFDHSMDGQCHLSSRNKNMVKGEFQPFAGWSYFERGLSGVSDAPADLPPAEGAPDEGGLEPAPVMAQHQQPQYVMMGASQQQQQKGKGQTQPYSFASQQQQKGNGQAQQYPFASQQQQKGNGQAQQYPFASQQQQKGNGQTQQYPFASQQQQKGNGRTQQYSFTSQQQQKGNGQTQQYSFASQQQQKGKGQTQRGQTVYMPRPPANQQQQKGKGQTQRGQTVYMPRPPANQQQQKGKGQTQRGQYSFPVANQQQQKGKGQTQRGQYSFAAANQQQQKGKGQTQRGQYSFASANQQRQKGKGQTQRGQYTFPVANQQQQKGNGQPQNGQTVYLPRPPANQQQQKGKGQTQRGQTVYMPRPPANQQQQKGNGQPQNGQTVYMPRPSAPMKAQPVVMPAPQNVVVLPQVVNLICPQGFIRHDRICYSFSGSPVNYTTAEGECSELGASLATINNENQHMFLSEYLNVVNPGENHWIGLEDRATENQFMYADSTPLGKFMKWAEGEPNDQGKDEDCVEMFPNGGGYFRWNDESCCRDRHYICQAPPERRITCFCHNHSTVCADDGVCADCQHNTEGDQCEKCKDGYEGFATQGTADSCRPAQQLVAVQVVQPKKPVMTFRMPK
ncbi:glutenin, high molecular weight subunit DY10-like isoform X3 [Branchiostoma floridae]|uniref:Glutenin, high molecular weight subunit DY10-like isoform X3 n=1 Tax=Branchiostoma floridae TaxID=7739 RepID=A0A9J7KRD4_BRAFL|nr:glutenin, high molecular weight subunit DY10-like isoform X3 [Branchiostoma floridae]